MLAVVFLAAPLTTAGKDTPVVVPVVGYTTNLACLQFMGLLIPITAAFTLIRSISTAQFTKSVSKATTGTIIGIDMGIGSAVRIFAPLIGGAVQGEGGLTAIAQLCAALCVVMAVLSALMMDAAAPDKAKQG